MSNSSSPVETPSLKRRLICLVYEAFLVIAVAALGILIFLVLMQKVDETIRDYLRPLALFAFVGWYLIHSWAGTGFTLAMKTWRIKLVKVGHAKVPLGAALLRYVCAWGWVLPGFAASYFLHLTRPQYAIALAANIVLWALTVFLNKDRQFLHDKIAGTRLILLPPPVKAVKSAA